MKLTIEQKNEIRNALADYCRKYPSQNKAVNSLKDTSVATVSAIVNGKFDKISDAMFLGIRDQITTERKSDWVLCDTKAYRDLTVLLQDAKEYQNVSWVIGNAGVGKTTTANHFAQSVQNVFVISCSEDMHRSDFIAEMARKIGVKSTGLTIRETLYAVTQRLLLLDTPLLIFDEGDKLNDTVLYYFISLYNALEDKCGMVFMSTNYMTKRMERGLRLNKKGYDEIHSRICRKFIMLTEASLYDVTNICRSNGLSNQQAIDKVSEDAKGCNYDLRRVKKAVHKHKLLLGQ